LFFANSKIFIQKENVQNFETEEEGKKIPSDYFFKQRAFPFEQINHEAYLQSIRQRKKFIRKKEQQYKGPSESWKFAGPTNIGGRITDIEIHPSDAKTIYACTASGGIFKSTDFGLNWQAIFDDKETLAIGDIAIAQSNKNTLYVGTGESNAGGGSLTYDGVGVYKSINAGEDWTYIGLPNSRSIGKVAIDPNDENKVFVAAMGNLFGNNADRGIYRTLDGGDNWEQVLYVSDSTGGIDLSINPNNPAIIYASLWERVRRADYRKYGGSSCGIYRSLDGGDSWEKLTNGLPQDDIGRIGVAVAPSDPSIVYAVAADESGDFKGFYVSEDNGDNWTNTNAPELYNTYFYASYGWWFGKLTVHPKNKDQIFAMGLDLYQTDNGGKNWSSNPVTNVHLDQHAMYIHEENPDTMVLGNDGGLYVSTDAGQTWQHRNNLPITQFYKCEIDYNNPEKIYGGAQDNGTIGTRTGDDDDWQTFYYGDGFVVKVDPINANFMYAEYQYGNFAKSGNGGSYFDLVSLPAGRYNWNTPYLLAPDEPTTIYLGSEKVLKSSDRGSTWSSISPDLSNGDPQTNLTYGTITTIDVSPVNSDIIYAGTDDGNVWRTNNSGTDWTLLSSDLPKRWVTAVVADPFDELKAYVTFSGYRFNEYLPHVFKTIDGGENWTDISANLPETPVNDLIVDPESSNSLYLATDVGVFISLNDGESWNILNAGMPNLVIADLSYHSPTKKLLAATYGRSMYDIDLSYLQEVVDTMMNDTTIVDSMIVDVDTFIVDVDTMMNDSITAFSTIDFPLSKLSVFPNPITVNSKILVELQESKFANISIYNTNGKLIKVVHEGLLGIGENYFEIPDLHLPDHLYFVVLEMPSSRLVQLCFF